MDPLRTPHRLPVSVAVISLLLLAAPLARAGEEPESAPAAAEAAPAAAVADDEAPPEDAAPTTAAETAPKKSANIGSVTDEVSVDRADSTPGNPRAGGIGNHLGASFNLGEAWAIDLGFDFTATQGTPPSTGTAFGDSGGRATSFSLGLDWDPNDHLSLGASLGFSPKAATASDTSLVFSASTTSTVQVSADAKLRSENSSATAGLTLSYDTAGESDLEWTFSGAVTGSHLDTTQVVTEVRRADGTILTAKELKLICDRAGGTCKKSLRQALNARAYQLDSLEFGASVMATIFGATDVRLGADVWAYSEDPTEVGFFSIAGAKSSGVSGGGGVPIAPMRGDVKLEVTHRFGAFSVRAAASGGGYVAGTGGGTYGGGLRLQYKITKTFRLWLTASARHDVDADGNDSVSRSGSLGAGLRF